MMSDKQTRCPKCTTIYKVTLTQLTIAQGMVCCPKCSINFNALTHLVQPAVSSETRGYAIKKSTLPTHIGERKKIGLEPSANILDIFERKIENSNIDLLTYLNNLNYFHNESTLSLPALHLSGGNALKEAPHPRSTRFYYLLWGSINVLLAMVLILQVLWFNPKIINDSPFFNLLFKQVCTLLTCEKLEDYYSQVKIDKVKVNRAGKGQTVFSGVIMNEYENSLQIPSIKLSLNKHNAEIFNTVILPEQYLTNDLYKVRRIPTHSPFKFKFTVPVDRKDFDDYHLEIIRP